MNKTLLFSFLLLLVTGVHSQVDWASSRYEAPIPVYENGREIGEVTVEISGEQIYWVNRDDLIRILRPLINADTLAQLEKLSPRIDPALLPLPMRFSPHELRLELTLSLEKRSQDQLELTGEQQRKFNEVALRPSPVGGVINYRLEQNWGGTDEADFFSAQFDNFINVHSFVLENQTFYESHQENKWFRGDTRLVKDFEESLIRVQAGDVYPLVQGFMISRPIGGVTIGRNFTLNPYRLPYPTGVQSFSLNSRSFVKYYVNGTLIRSEYLPPGNYTASDIPLANGLNTVTIEATDELGDKKVFVFRSASSINLLNQGESRFDLSYGIPFLDENFRREYREKEEGKLLSGFWQQGITQSFSTSFYGQNQSTFSLLGTELISATGLGNFSFGHAESVRENEKGSGQSLTYQFLSEGQSAFSQSLTARFEHRSKEFLQSYTDGGSVVKNVYSTAYTIPLANAFTVSLGGNYGDVRDNSLSDRYGYDLTLNFRLHYHSSLSLFLGRSRDEFRRWNDVGHIFLTIAFPDSSDFISAYHDIEARNTKLSYIRDNQNRLYTPRAQAAVENSESQRAAEADVLYPMPFAEIGGRIRTQELVDERSILARGSLRLNSAIAFAYDKGDLALGLSRPLNNSFVLFQPDKRLKGQQIALKSTSPYTESESGPWDEITFGNLLPYQFREIQLDPSELEEGRSLKRENFVVYPTYRSAHLIRLEDTGALMLRGRLVSLDGTPHSLQVGEIGDKMFFTNRNGEFFVDGIEYGTHSLHLRGIEAEHRLVIPEDQVGILNLGELTLEEEF